MLYSTHRHKHFGIMLLKLIQNLELAQILLAWNLCKASVIGFWKGNFVHWLRVWAHNSLRILYVPKHPSLKVIFVYVSVWSWEVNLGAVVEQRFLQSRWYLRREIQIWSEVGLGKYWCLEVEYLKTCKTTPKSTHSQLEGTNTSPAAHPNFTSYLNFSSEISSALKKALLYHCPQTKSQFQMKKNTNITLRKGYFGVYSILGLLWTQTLRQWTKFPFQKLITLTLHKFRACKIWASSKFWIGLRSMIPKYSKIFVSYGCYTKFFCQ